MKATDLKKTSIPLEDVYKDIECANKNHQCKISYPHWMYFSDAFKLELIRQGFKVYEGEWRANERGLIIEW